MAVIELDLSEIRDGYVGDPNIGVAVPVYDAERDEIVNYMGYVINESEPSRPYLLQIGGFGQVSKYDFVADDDEHLYTTAVQGVAPNWNLLYVVRSVLEAVGYQVDLSEYDVEPFNRIFLACPTASMADALPHWTVREFVEQVQNFLCAVAVFEPGARVVRFRPRRRVARTEREFRIVDDFSVENVDGEGAGGALASNLVYAKSDVDFHVYDFVDDEMLDAMPKQEFQDYASLLSAYNAATREVKANTLWVCPQGMYALWVFDEGDRNVEAVEGLVRVNVFGRLVKDEEYGDLELKIAPAAMSDDIPCPIYCSKADGYRHEGSRVRYTVEWREPMYGRLPVIERRVVSRRVYGGTIQEIIEGCEAEQDETNKPDRIDVVLVDYTLQHYRTGAYRGYVVPGDGVPMGFTSCDYKGDSDEPHSSWSLSLNPTARVASVGDLHDGKTVANKSRHYITFLSDRVPSAEDIFIFRGKCFLAEKIEACIVDGKVDKLMSGYFFEML